MAVEHFLNPTRASPLGGEDDERLGHRSDRHDPRRDVLMARQALDDRLPSGLDQDQPRRARRFSRESHDEKVSAAAVPQDRTNQGASGQGVSSLIF